MRKLVWLIALLPFLFAAPTGATEPTSDCVIRDFRSNLKINTDSSLNITESLAVDCGNLSEKHGIFRILPIRAPRPDGYYNKTKISDVTIKDEDGTSYQFETISDNFNPTISWKIGDPDVTISGIHTYNISYKVLNATYDQNGRTIFNWNLSGNFWELPIDNFTATITLPSAATNSNTTVSLIDGLIGDTGNNHSTYVWSADGQITVNSTDTFAPGVGTTLNADMPTGIVTPYQPSFLDRYGGYFWLLLPLTVFVLLYRLWSKKGRDPKLQLAEMVQYSPPQGLLPLEVGLLETNGSMKNQFLTAIIVDLAVRGYLSIEELPKKFLSAKDYLLTLLTVDETLVDYEKTVLENLFGGLTPKATTLLSAQKSTFYTAMSGITKSGKDKLQALGLMDISSLNWRIGVIIAAVILFGLGVFIVSATLSSAGWAIILTGIIALVFGILMDRRTVAGAKAFWELRGFKLYIDKVEKHRDKFYEQENIFEKYLPYAIVFGMTGKWIKACQQLYTDKNMVMPIPLWYLGGTNMSMTSFDSSINSLSSQIGSSLASSPSSGGGGMSGGGGGGGGGGSW